MKYYVMLMVCLAGAVGLVSAQAFKDLATVRLTKTETIKVGDFEKEVKDLETKAGKQLDPTLKKQFLDSKIDDILFTQAADEDKVYITDDDVIKVMKQLYNIENDADFQKLVQSTGLPLKEVLSKARPKAAMFLYIKKKKPEVTTSKPTVSDSEIEKRYSQELQSFLAPEMVKFRVITILTTGKDAATKASIRARMESIAKQAKTGGKTVFQDFYDKSGSEKDYLCNETRVFQGQPVYVQNFGESFLSALFALHKGDISGVIESTQGLHVVYVLEHDDPRLYKLDEPLPDQPYTGRDQIRQRILAEKSQEIFIKARESTVADLRARASITIDPSYKW